MSGRTKKRSISPANAKKSDVSTLLLQKRSKSSNAVNDRNIFQQLLCTAVPLRRTNIGGFFVDWKLMQCKSIHVLSVRHNVPTSGRSTVIKNRFLINKNHQQLLGSQSKFLKWIKRVQMCNGANYSTVHRHDLVEQTIWIWRYHRWHCHMSHNLFWAHEFPFFQNV